MAFLDIAVIAVILLSALIAFSTGFVRLVLGLLGWVGAGFATLYGFRYVQPLVRQWISSELLADAAAGIGLFLVSMTLLTMISHSIGKQVRDSSLSALDRSLGLVAGLCIGTIVVSLGYFALVWAFDLPKDRNKHPEWAKSAKTFPVIVWGAKRVRSILPESLRENLPDPGGASITPGNSFEKLVTPETNDIKKKDKPGYSDAERREMDRLIKGQR